MLVLSLPGRGEMKFRREHSGDGVNHIIQGERLAKNVSLAAEVAAEKCVRQDDDTALRRICRGCVEAGAYRRLHAEQGEDIRRRARPFDSLRLGSAGQI